MVLAVNSWDHAAMPVVAAILFMAILLRVGLHPTCCRRGFGLSSSPGLRGRVAGQNMILPIV